MVSDEEEGITSWAGGRSRWCFFDGVTMRANDLQKEGRDTGLSVKLSELVGDLKLPHFLVLGVSGVYYAYYEVG
ncbi:hypothetical protein HZ326_2984 [Fusarium oxysporum f. sp. albedinis]|nr:hypothetical protein HZ326_2984 [Fusarium oxysporum f. sp. albedinis]